MDYLPRENRPNDEAAQGMVEYALIMAAVVVPVVAVLTLTFPRLQEIFRAIINQVGEGPPAL